MSNRRKRLGEAGEELLMALIREELPDSDPEQIMVELDKCSLSFEAADQLMDRLAGELTWREDWEPDEHGLLVEDLIDYVNWIASAGPPRMLDLCHPHPPWVAILNAERPDVRSSDWLLEHCRLETSKLRGYWFDGSRCVTEKQLIEEMKAVLELPAYADDSLDAVRDLIWDIPFEPENRDAETYLFIFLSAADLLGREPDVRIGRLLEFLESMSQEAREPASISWTESRGPITIRWLLQESGGRARELQTKLDGQGVIVPLWS